LLTGNAQEIVVDNGVVTVTEGGVIEFIPDYQYVGEVSIPYVIVDSDGATATANEIITIILEDECLNVYKEFSPDNDGINDYLHINCIEEYKDTNSVEIFNRWGNTVYKASGYDNETVKFIGESNGRATLNISEQLPVGTYFYVINLGDGSDILKGWIYVNRK